MNAPMLLTPDALARIDTERDAVVAEVLLHLEGELGGDAAGRTQCEKHGARHARR